MRSVTPFLWLDGTAEQAALLYASVFDDCQLGEVARYPDGSAMSVSVMIRGLTFTLFNGGPDFTLDEAFSLSVVCEGQDEIDRYWSALTADGGAESQCGWLKDRYGISWQIVPDNLGELIGNEGGMTAMRGMTKLDIAALKAAAS